MSFRAAALPFATALPITAAVLTLGLAACGGSGNDGGTEPQGSATMRPGDGCNAAGCHTFTAAGTVYASGAAAADAGVSGATVVIDDGVHTPITLTTNAAGNFYTSASFTPPATVTVTRPGQASTNMVGTLNAGHVDCNGCHNLTGVKGRIY